LMAILNLNSKIYSMIKDCAKVNCRSIHSQALYYFLLGKLFEENRNTPFEKLHERVVKFLNNFKTTG